MTFGSFVFNSRVFNQDEKSMISTYRVTSSSSASVKICDADPGRVFVKIEGTQAGGLILIGASQSVTESTSWWIQPNTIFIDDFGTGEWWLAPIGGVTVCVLNVTKSS